MKPVKDEHENVIEIGQLALLYLGSPVVKGRIVEITDGEIKRVFLQKREGKEVINGQVLIHIDMPFLFDPTQRTVPGLSVLADPDPEKAAKIREMYSKAKHTSSGSGLLELPN